jgi:hypothetical protein
MVVQAAQILLTDIKASEEGRSKGSFIKPISTNVKNAVMELQQKGKSRLSSIKGSYLYQIPLPESMESKTYGALYEYLSKQDIIPLGLLRGTFNSLILGPMANKLPYVYANPSKDTVLYSCDKVFVLSMKPVGVNPNQGVKVINALYKPF